MKERLGLNSKYNKPLTESEQKKIIEYYNNHQDYLDLDTFSKDLGRSKISISRYARKNNLTKHNRKKPEEIITKQKNSYKKYMGTNEYINNVKPKQKELLLFYLQNNHPKGMLGKHHSEETCKKLSESHIKLFRNMSQEEKHDRAMKAVETKRKNGGLSTTSNSYSRCKGGIRDNLNQYFRSAWEANIARVLSYLHIEWKYEYKRFNFENEVEGVLSYQPDFYLPNIDKWIEVKGWMDEKSKKRLDLFKKYYPKENENLYLVDELVYREIEQKYSSLIKNWEHKNNYKNHHVDKENPRIEITIRPVDYIGVFDNASQLDEFKHRCIGCKRYKRNCSLLKKAIEGRIQKEIYNGECEKYSPISK